MVFYGATGSWNIVPHLSRAYPSPNEGIFLLNTSEIHYVLSIFHLQICHLDNYISNLLELLPLTLATTESVSYTAAQRTCWKTQLITSPVHLYSLEELNGSPFFLRSGLTILSSLGHQLL